MSKQESPTIDPQISAAAAAMGRRGGRNGTGEVKRRPLDHYRRITKLAAAARKEKSEKSP